MMNPMLLLRQRSGRSFLISMDTFPFVTAGIPLLANKVYLGAWASDKSFERSLRTWPSAPGPYVSWVDQVQPVYGDL